MIRQQRLSAIDKAAVDYKKELDACHKAIIYGLRDHIGQMPPVPLPTDDELRADAKKERERIAQIDQELHAAATGAPKSIGH